MRSQGELLLDLPRALAVALSLQLPVEVPQLGLKVSLVGGRGPRVGPLGSWNTASTANQSAKLQSSKSNFRLIPKFDHLSELGDSLSFAKYLFQPFMLMSGICKYVIF